MDRGFVQSASRRAIRKSNSRGALLRKSREFSSSQTAGSRIVALSVHWRARSRIFCKKGETLACFSRLIFRTKKQAYEHKTHPIKRGHRVDLDRFAGDGGPKE